MRLPVLIFGAALCAGGCKQSTGSQVESLDNFARKDDAGIHNQCMGSYALSSTVRLYSDADDANVLQNLAKAATAIPPRLQKIFFEVDSGAVMATSSYSRDCETHLRNAPMSERRYLSEGKGKISGCVDKRDDVKVATIRIAPTAAAAEHELVRMFGLLYAQVYGPRTFSNWRNATEALTTRFLRDIADNPRLSIEPYEGMLNSEAGYRRFVDFVFAEAFDSYYCSSQTRMRFASQFPRTYQSFSELRVLLETR